MRHRISPHQASHQRRQAAGGNACRLPSQALIDQAIEGSPGAPSFFKRAWKLKQPVHRHLKNARDRPRDTLANVLAQPGKCVPRDTAAMFPARGVKKKHQCHANTRANSKTFLHRFLRKKIIVVEFPN
jgi:hypothetical protein